MFQRLREIVGATALALSMTVAGLVPGVAWAEDGKTIRMCYTTWGKHGGEDLPGKGFVPDLMTRVMEHAGYAVTVDIVPWPRCINQAKDQRYDMVASGWRGANFDPYFEYFSITLRNDINFIVLKDSDVTDGALEAFHGKTIGHVRDSGGIDQIRGNPNIKTQEVAVMDKMLSLLLGGRIDAIVSDPEGIFGAAAALDPPRDGDLRALDPPLVTNVNSPLVAKGHPKLEQYRTDFEASFKVLIKAGIYQELIDIHGPEFVYQLPIHVREAGNEAS